MHTYTFQSVLNIWVGWAKPLLLQEIAYIVYKKILNIKKVNINTTYHNKFARKLTICITATINTSKTSWRNDFPPPISIRVLNMWCFLGFSCPESCHIITICSQRHATYYINVYKFLFSLKIMYVLFCILHLCQKIFWRHIYSTVACLAWNIFWPRNQPLSEANSNTTPFRHLKNTFVFIYIFIYYNIFHIIIIVLPLHSTPTI